MSYIEGRDRSQRTGQSRRREEARNGTLHEKSTDRQLEEGLSYRTSGKKIALSPLPLPRPRLALRGGATPKTTIAIIGQSVYDVFPIGMAPSILRPLIATSDLHVSFVLRTPRGLAQLARGLAAT